MKKQLSTVPRGLTLIDTMVGIALMVLVFVGIYGTFQLTVDVVTNEKAQAGALGLADERMEYLRSLGYSAVGTVGGVPSGNLPQTESLSLNGISYTRRTYIEYDDDPADGLGSSDTNGIIEDYKSAKVEVLWSLKGITHSVVLVARFSPTTGMESAVPGGTLIINAVNSVGAPISGASVAIVATSASPTVNINTFTNASGTATVLGAPAYSGYQVTVTASGYSTASTYSVTSQNTNPNPGNLSVTKNHTTSATFAIDLLGTKTVNTWTQVLSGTSTDPFNNTSEIATSTGISVTGGAAQLAVGSTTGEVQSVAFSPSYLADWGTFTWSDTQPASTSIRYRLYSGDGTTLVPDSYVPGNAAGFVSGSVSLSGVPTSTYPSLRLDAVFSSASTTTTPSLTLWSITDSYGPVPLPNIAFNLQGGKTIGSGPGGTLYKYSQNFSTAGNGSITIPGLEWDNYTVTISGSSGYDVASACNPQPESLSPGSTMTSNFYLAAHTGNSLLVDVRGATSGALIPNASVQLSIAGYNKTIPTDNCGQAFFSGVSASSNYSISVSAPGYSTYNGSAVSVNGTSRLSVSLN